ncbi:CBS domain-containing protein [Evansella cellulosilytica]|uniref:CBS domain containing protein n=1 Tax=Evansella cellulosilytica (strain ATCC 21833 / DSM 2522 / FERM P-1141 / JCM 9156 / N-4) TaxID=649639 RepID=E6TVZ5_EVAC2|nr:CBS domain-containing protein [Evansella cellulosilytica]ADU29818.1 CBS domain containing protein [Evansella cellulosilytica DSM 2522]
MEIITSHTNLDFDGLASIIAAKKIHPHAKVVLPDRLSQEVRSFLGLYKDTFSFTYIHSIQTDTITKLIIVDTNTLSRTSINRNSLNKNVCFFVYDHHPLKEESINNYTGEISKVGATITILTEQLQKNNINISPLESTLFALGLYTDTGSFTYETTTERDLKAGAWLLQKGANLTIVEQFRKAQLSATQQNLLQMLLDNSKTHTIDGVEIVISSHHQQDYIGQLAIITRRILELTGSDAVFSIVKMGEKVFITGRSNSERVNLLPVIRELGGGGHKSAASAVKKNNDIEIIYEFIKKELSNTVSPSMTAQHLMSTPVHVVAEETSVEEASKMLYRYGHTGFPVINASQLVGVISRRDIDKALHHQLGHAPVKGFMSRNPLTISPEKSLEAIQALMIDKQVGRLPVLENGKLVGIVTRSDVIHAMHGKLKSKGISTTRLNRMNVRQEMKQQYTSFIYKLLKEIGIGAQHLNMRAYLIGGMVRDLLLQRPNEDVDIVVEGDGMKFATYLQEKFGGQVRLHEEFKTATWKHPNNLKIDVTSARTEFYDFPAALPKVEMSTMKEDLYRRDFTINAMGIALHKDQFGVLIDYFQGYNDLLNKKIKILYNLSFIEDPTRILRAVRFECRFQFKMDEETFLFAKEAVNNIPSLSKTRLSNELKKMFQEENPALIIDRLHQLNILPLIITTIDTYEAIERRVQSLKHSIYELYKKEIRIEESIWIAYLIMMTSSIETNELVILERYDLNKDEIKLMKEVFYLVEAQHHVTTESPMSDWHEIFNHTSTEAIITYYSYQANELVACALNYILAREHLIDKVTGEDLIQAGLQPNTLFKSLLIEGEKLKLDMPSLRKDEVLQKLLVHYKNMNKRF